jgi:xylose isomerase
MPDCATTLLALNEIGLPNLGVTLDFAHVLYADEQPAYAAALIARHSHLLGLHLNDGYSKRDDGLMVAAVHLIQTILPSATKSHTVPPAAGKFKNRLDLYLRILA